MSFLLQQLNFAKIFKYRQSVSFRPVVFAFLRVSKPQNQLKLPILLRRSHYIDPKNRNMSSFTPVPASDWAPTGAPGSLEALCCVTKRACDVITPMIVEFYHAMNSSTSKLKADKSVFTIADGTVQHLLTEHLYGNLGAMTKFNGLVGEESCEVNLITRPFTVDGLEVPEEFSDMVERTKDEIEALSACIPAGEAGDLYSGLTIFVDPIDGTREFSTGKGEESSFCIGFADSTGMPVAGVVYRPITNPPTWAAGAKSEGYKAGVLDIPVVGHTGGLLTSNGAISPFIGNLLTTLDYTRVPSGGAGNKMLMLLEGKGSAYIQDRGVSRWDTCAAQACIEAYGGVLCKLTSFIASTEGHVEAPMASTHYTYLQSPTNLDFTAGSASLTMYNCSPLVKKAIKKGDVTLPKLATDITDVAPYSNLCGLVALSEENNTVEKRRAVHAAVLAAIAMGSPVAYD